MFRIAPFLTAIAVMFAAFGPAQATPVTLNFPSTQSTYSGFWVGNGTVPSGYKTPSLYVAGDNVSQQFTGVPLYAITSLDYSLDVFDAMMRGDLALNFVINGIVVGTVTVPEDSGSGHRRNYTGNFTFDAVVGNGAFTIDLVLAQNAPIGSSIAIYDGGRVVVDGLTQAPTPAPEPATLALFGAGLAAFGVKRRKCRK
jgi:hypothetical protein